MKTEQRSDRQTWNEFRAGDREAFAQLFESHYRQLYAYGKQFLTDASLTEDAIQDLFIALWRTRGNLSEVDNVKFYLFRCLRRNIRRLSEREKRSQAQDFSVMADTLFNQLQTADFTVGDDDTLLNRRLKSIIDELPRRQREAVLLRYYENFKPDEIAIIMGVSEKTVRNTLFNAMTSLRESSDLLKACLGIILSFLYHSDY